MRVGTPGFLGERLVEARQARGLLQADLARQLCVTRQTVSRYEKGELSPAPSVFNEIVAILKLPSRFFFATDPVHLDQATIRYRARQSVSARERVRAKARLGWVSRIAAHALKFVNFPELDLPHALLSTIPDDPRKLSVKEIVGVAAGLREHWGIGQSPIPHLIRLLESKGIVIALDDLGPSGVDAVSAWAPKLGFPLILLNRSIDTAVRRRFTTAHELGELCLHRNIDLDLRANKKFITLLEKQVHLFAASFLLPEEAFLGDLSTTSLNRLLRLKRKWQVSVAMMIVRLHNLGVITDATYSDLYRRLSRRGWKRFEPLDDQIAIEEPVLLNQALEVINGERLQARHEILTSIALDRESAQRLANSRPEFFDKCIHERDLVRSH